MNCLRARAVAETKAKPARKRRGRVLTDEQQQTRLAAGNWWISAEYPHGEYATLNEARQSIFDYIETFYNRTRRHSSRGYISPEAFEAAAN